MTTEVLFIQGAGDGAHVEDQALADYLQSALGSGFDVRYPRFQGLEDVDHAQWIREIHAAWKDLDNGAIVVAHSLGGAALLKFLSENTPRAAIRGLFLVAVPYKGKDGEWGTDDFAMATDFAATLPEVGPIVMYHSADDEWVPYSHLDRWAEKLPKATVRRFTDRGHSFAGTAFVELVGDIRALCG